MQINVTCVIQIIHFIIVYQILKRYFFKDIVSVLQDKEKTKQRLTENLKDKELTLTSLQDEKKKNIDTFKHMLKEKYVFSSMVPKDVFLGIFYQKDEKRLAKLTQSVEKLISEKAPHVF